MKPYKIPKVIIDEIIPIIEVDNKIYASQIIIKFGNQQLQLYDNNGLDLTAFLGKEMECVFEVTKGYIRMENPKYSFPNALSTTYLWDQPAYMFFSSLIQIQDFPESLDLSLSKDIEKRYESKAKELFENWGTNGLGLDMYDSKPMLLTDLGVILINEYEFEDSIDRWKLKEDVLIEIEEARLLGIRPYVPKREEEIELTPEQKEAKAKREAIKQERRAALAALKERVRKRIEAGEGPSIVE